jgi:hypothetical protein
MVHTLGAFDFVLDTLRLPQHNIVQLTGTMPDLAVDILPFHTLFECRIVHREDLKIRMNFVKILAVKRIYYLLKVSVGHRHLS